MSKFARFRVWLNTPSSPPGSGVCVRDWLTPEELEQCVKGTQEQFWRWHYIAEGRKQSAEGSRELARMLPFVILALILMFYTFQ